MCEESKKVNIKAKIKIQDILYNCVLHSVFKLFKDRLNPHTIQLRVMLSALVMREVIKANGNVERKWGGEEWTGWEEKSTEEKIKIKWDEVKKKTRQDKEDESKKRRRRRRWKRVCQMESRENVWICMCTYIYMCCPQAFCSRDWEVRRAAMVTTNPVTPASKHSHVHLTPSHAHFVMVKVCLGLEMHGFTVEN